MTSLPNAFGNLPQILNARRSVQDRAKDAEQKAIDLIDIANEEQRLNAAPVAPILQAIDALRSQLHALLQGGATTDWSLQATIDLVNNAPGVLRTHALALHKIVFEWLQAERQALQQLMALPPQLQTMQQQIQNVPTQIQQAVQALEQQIANVVQQITLLTQQVNLIPPAPQPPQNTNPPPNPPQSPKAPSPRSYSYVSSMTVEKSDPLPDRLHKIMHHRRYKGDSLGLLATYFSQLTGIAPPTPEEKPTLAPQPSPAIPTGKTGGEKDDKTSPTKAEEPKKEEPKKPEKAKAAASH